MSVLAWLFGLGAAAVVFPILFHLIRRTPKGETEFSSLMFLKASPPTLTRRSRLDNLWLLFLRALAICLLAIAFMRPFFRGSSEIAQFDVEHRRVAILLDVSASMQRGSVWQDAKKRVLKTLTELEDRDQVALYTFDRDVNAIVDFPEKDAVQQSNREAIATIKQKLQDIDPTWMHSDLGGALVAVAEQMDGWQDSFRNDETGVRPKLQVYVVSDMQAGSATEALQAYQWPQLVKVKFESVAPMKSDNATVELLSPAAKEKQPSVRVRVTNQSDAESEAFTVRWETRERPDLKGRRTGETSVDPSESLSFVVAAGESRVLSKPLEEVVKANAFSLEGDDEAFDNVFFVAPASPQTLSMMYIGDDDPDDPQSALFYLARVFSRTPTRSFVLTRVSAEEMAEASSEKELVGLAEVISINGEREREGETGDNDAEKQRWLQADRSTMLILGTALTTEQRRKLEGWVEGGASVFALANRRQVLESAMELLGVTGIADSENDSENVREADDESTGNNELETRESYSMLADIEFKDPVFQPFADPKFSDFTSIRFWNHQRVTLDTACETLARFDDRSPAVWRCSRGQGEVIAMASSWRPLDSQFALSSKFVALVSNLLELAADVPVIDAARFVGDPLLFDGDDRKRIVIKPNGCLCDVESKATRFRGTTQPGIYRLTTESDSGEVSPEQVFAVNVDRRESQTDVMAVEQIERLGVQVGLQTTAASEVAQLREIRDQELESQQQIWKWLIVAAIAILIFESFYSGWKSNQSTAKLGAETEPSPVPM